jgi:hypothetical protein
MKSLFLLLFLFPLVCHSQNFIGIKAGVNKSDLIGDGIKGFEKSGFNGGFLFQLKLNKSFSGQINLLFSNKGCAYNWKDPDLTKSRHFVKLYYIDFPILFLYHFKKIVFEAGPGLAYLINYREYIPGYSLNNAKYPFNWKDITMNAGIHYNVYDNFGLNFLYSFSIMPIRNEPSRQYNNVFTLSLDYLLPLAKKTKP